MTPAVDMEQEPVLVLDTSAMHSACLYLRLARDGGLWPFGGECHAASSALKAGHVGRTRDNLKQGLRLVYHLKHRSDAGARIEYPPVGRIELACGLLRGQAILDAANEGMPHRMWTRIDELEVLDRLSGEAYLSVAAVLDSLEDHFTDAGIALDRTDPGHARDNWALAGELLRLVFLDLGDSIVYASAALALADDLVTTDRYLRRVANAIRNPAGFAAREEQFTRAKQEVVRLISEALGMAEGDVRLPTAKKIPSLPSQPPDTGNAGPA